MAVGLAVSSLAPLAGGDVRPASLPDKQLLERFFRRREDAAFAALVERHGPLVYRVCRRVLRDTNDVDDAFQATFLVLVRKGATLEHPERLSSWLYGVAFRTAHKIRVRTAVRSKHEREASEMPTTADASGPAKGEDLTLSELRSILDDEIGKLPEKYALPLTLCYLEGKTNAQAAASLGWPEGSMSRRLSKARELLRSRLARRGLAITAALIASVFAQPVKACPPPSLIETTVAAGCALLSGAPLAGLVSSQASAAVGYVITGGVASLAKLIASVSLAVGSLGLALVVGLCQFGSQDGPIRPVDLYYYFIAPAPSDTDGEIAVPCGPPAPGSTIPILPPPHAQPAK